MVFFNAFIYLRLIYLFLNSIKLEAEVSYSVVIRDISYHAAKSLHICRILTVLNPLAEKLAHDSSEVLMSCV